MPIVWLQHCCCLRRALIDKGYVFQDGFSVQTTGPFFFGKGQRLLKPNWCGQSAAQDPCKSIDRVQIGKNARYRQGILFEKAKLNHGSRQVCAVRYVETGSTWLVITELTSEKEFLAHGDVSPLRGSVVFFSPPRLRLPLPGLRSAWAMTCRPSRA